MAMGNEWLVFRRVPAALAVAATAARASAWLPGSDRHAIRSVRPGRVRRYRAAPDRVWAGHGGSIIDPARGYGGVRGWQHHAAVSRGGPISLVDRGVLAPAGSSSTSRRCPPLCCRFVAYYAVVDLNLLVYARWSRSFHSCISRRASSSIDWRLWPARWPPAATCLRRCHRAGHRRRLAGGRPIGRVRPITERTPACWPRSDRGSVRRGHVTQTACSTDTQPHGGSFRQQAFDSWRAQRPWRARRPAATGRRAGLPLHFQ